METNGIWKKAIITRYLKPIRLNERHIIVENGEKIWPA